MSHGSVCYTTSDVPCHAPIASGAADHKAERPNTPATVPLSARKTPVTATVDPNIKGRARFIAAQEAVNTRN